jgi:hypothetical protein
VIRAMMRSIDVILEAALFNNHEKQGKLLCATASYHNAIKLLNKHCDQSEDEMDEFQNDADVFFELWVEIFGKQGVTNYVHLIGSGHMLYFLKHYGCLYLYSQQGWQALMGKVQAILHLNTQRGGKRSGEGKTKSFIYPVVIYILRELLWKTGNAKHFFLEHEHKLVAYIN